MTSTPRVALPREPETPEERYPGARFERRPTLPGKQPWDVVQFGERFPPPRRTQGEPLRKPSHVYVMGLEGSTLVKIGFTTGDPKQRLAGLQTGQPAALSLLWHCEGSATLERDLHRRFQDRHVRGEWFDLTPLGDPIDLVRTAVADMAAA